MQPRRPQKVLRLTFEVTGGEVRLRSAEPLEMILPPQVGERPEAGRHGGYWMEVHDDGDNALFHHLLHQPFGNSVEVHSPEGKIERVFGEPADGIFEVVVPDDPQARDLVLMGQSPASQDNQLESVAGGSTELARFAFPKEGGR
jgi:hypothetical protein